MRQLNQSESFVVIRNRVTVSELTPLRRHRFVPAAVAVEIFRAAPAIDADRFRASLDSWAVQDTLPCA